MDKDQPDHGAVHRVAREQEAKILQASKGADAGDSVLGGNVVLGKGNAAYQGGSDKNKKAEASYLNAILMEIDRINDQLSGLYQQRDDLIGDLNDITAKQTQLQNWQRSLDSGNLPELDETGAIRDDDLEALVAAYEKRTGHSVDRTDPMALMAIIAAEQRVQQTAFDDTNEALRDVQEKIDPLEKRLDELQGDKSEVAPITDRNDQRQDMVYSELDIIQKADPVSGSTSNFDNFSL
ncbi:MAG: hypothetical protein JKY46_04520 [Robiginitomaculum sp.]|nr:hypothetical protein [Robiginitomaculum sp.]